MHGGERERERVCVGGGGGEGEGEEKRVGFIFWWGEESVSHVLHFTPCRRNHATHKKEGEHVAHPPISFFTFHSMMTLTIFVVFFTPVRKEYYQKNQIE